MLSKKQPPVQMMKNATLKLSISLVLALFSVSFLFTGCGSSTIQATPPPNSAVTQVAVTCTPASVATGETSKCNASVTGTGSYSTAVTWSASGGSVDASGMFIAPTSPGSATVTAISAQDTTKSGNAAVAVQAPASTISGVAVTCAATTIVPAATSQCSATVTGTGGYASTVTWAASAGTIDANGLLTAPASAGSITVTATSTQDTTKSGNAAVTVQAVAATVSAVSVTCNPTTVAPGATSQCSATVTGTGSYATTVTWAASGGSISAAGLLTAPNTAGSVTVTATSTQVVTIAGTATVTVQAGTPAIPPSQHVVIVLQENQSYDLVVGRTDRWPNLNNLMTTGALATNFYANAHFSIPNYFMLTSGVILSKNDNTVKTFNADNIARRLLAANMSFKVYAQSLPQAGYVGGNTGLYVKRHNPFAYYTDFTTDPAVAAAHIVPFTQFATDVANNALPAFSFIVPDLVDDGHDSNPPVADEWMQANVTAPLQALPAFQTGGDGLLIVDFDESVDTDTAYGGGHIPPVFWGPNVQPGFKQTSTTIFQQQSLLRTMMEALGLPNPMGAAATAPSMAEFFK